MGQYRVRDMFLVPGLLSLARLPLAALFPVVLGRPVAAVSVLGLAGLSDVLDGWYARRFRQVTPIGAVVDPVTDKIFVLTAVISLVAADHLSGTAVLLLSTREIGELPLAVWLSASGRARGDRARQPIANVPGKIATAMQFATVATAIYRSPWLDVLLGATAAAGAVAALTYWLRALAPGCRDDADVRLSEHAS